jgi:hypothetical protein
VIAVLQISAALTFMNLRNPLLVCVKLKKEEIGTLERILRRISGVEEERRSLFDEAIGIDAVRISFAVSLYTDAILSVRFWVER